MDTDENFAIIGAETDIVTGVSDVTDNIPCDGFPVDFCFCCDFTGDDDQICGTKRLTCHAAHRILLDARIENGIGDLIGDFVRMSF